MARGTRGKSLPSALPGTCQPKALVQRNSVLSVFVVNVRKGLCTSVGVTSVFTSSYWQVSSYYSVTSAGFGDDLVIPFFFSLLSEK